MEQKINAIVISSSDNVATVTSGIKSGETVRYLLGGVMNEITSVTDIPQYHKISLKDIDEGGKVIKYGETMAVATSPIKKGSHVHNHNVASEVSSS